MCFVEHFTRFKFPALSWWEELLVLQYSHWSANSSHNNITVTGDVMMIQFCNYTVRLLINISHAHLPHCIYAHTHTHSHTHTPLHTNTCTHIHAHTHTHTHSNLARIPMPTKSISMLFENAGQSVSNAMPHVLYMQRVPRHGNCPLNG